MKIVIDQVVAYRGHSVKPSGAVALTLGAMFGEVTSSMKLIQLLNEDVSVKAKAPSEKALFVGIFRISGINFAKDGKSTIKLLSIDTAVNQEALQYLLSAGSVKVRYEGNVETEDE